MLKSALEETPLHGREGMKPAGRFELIPRAGVQWRAGRSRGRGIRYSRPSPSLLGRAIYLPPCENVVVRPHPGLKYEMFKTIKISIILKETIETAPESP